MTTRKGLDMENTLVFDTTEFDQHMTRKSNAGIKRQLDRKFKTRERVKTAKYQKICDDYKRRLSKKGIGRAMKVKGVTMPTAMPCNDKTTKSWTRVGYGENKPLREGFKHGIIYAIT